MRGIRLSMLVRCAAIVAVVGGFAGEARAQPQQGNQLPQTRLNTISPVGGKAGSTLEITFTGTDLETPEAVLFSHPGIKGEPVIVEVKDDPKDKDKDKDKGKEQPKGKGKGKGKGPDVAKFTVTIASDVPVGAHDVRIVGKHGISNARSFVVGDLAEVQEKEPNNDIDQAQRVEINSTVNGTIANPVDVDYYVFPGKKGQRVLVHCQAASIDSRLSPEMKLLDKDHREIANQRAAPLTDGLLDVTLPADGDYKIRLVQFAHQLGGVDLFYRLSITTAPWIDAVSPPMVEPGKTSEVTVYGRNLPGGKLDPNVIVGGRALEKVTVKIAAPKGAAANLLDFRGNVQPATALLDGFEYRIKNAAGSSNPFLFTFAQGPVVVEKGGNNTPETAQVVTVPCEIAGSLDRLNQRDWYTFTCKKGEAYYIEAFSHRLGAPTDLLLTLRNATDKTPTDIVVLDDSAETLSPTFFLTSSRDPAPYRFVAPADGKYQLSLRSHFSANLADVTHCYRIRITPDVPDYRLIVMPADQNRPDTCSVGQGGNQDITVFVVRKDGFKGDVKLTAEGLPPGVTCKPQIVAANQKQGFLVLSATLDAKPWAGTIKVKGSAVIDGKKVEREARAASITWSVPPAQNIQTVTRLERDFVMAVVDGKAPYALNCGIDKAVVVHGDKLTVPLKVLRHWPDFKTPLQIVPIPQEMPQGVNFGPLTLQPGKDDGTLSFIIPGNVPTGTYTFVFRSFAPIPVGPTGKAKAVNVVQCSTPVTVTVIPKQVANLSVSNAAPALKPGGQMLLSVKVARTNAYTDSFSVKLILPKEIKGLAAEEVTIPAGENEVVLLLQADDDAEPGPRNNITIRATAMVHGVALTQETKINVTLTK